MLSFIRSLGFGAVIIAMLTGCGVDSGDSGDSSDSSDSGENGEGSVTLLVRAELPLEVLLGNIGGRVEMNSENDIRVTVEVNGAGIAKSTDPLEILPRPAKCGPDKKTETVPWSPLDRPSFCSITINTDVNVATGMIDVQPGSDRTITLRAYQGGLEKYRGSILTDILSGENSTVKVTMKSLENPTATKAKVIEATIGSGAVVIAPRSVMCPITGSRLLTAEILNELGEAVIGDVIWESSNPFVATVTEAGLVTITGSGEALITATSGTRIGTVVVSGAETENRDITFFMTADPQYSCNKDNDDAGKCGKNQLKMIAQMNALPGKFDGFCGLGVARPRGVLVAGDLTQNGWEQTAVKRGARYKEYDTFLDQWGLKSSPPTSPKLHFRVFEGYGNHDDLNGKGNDSDPLDFNYYCGATGRDSDKCTSPIIDKVRERNVERAKWVGSGLEGFWSDDFTEGAPNSSWRGGLHYSWRWDDVHFVNLNLYGGSSDNNGHPTYARDALKFLKDDLKDHVGDSGRPIVIMQHYGFDQWSTQYPRKNYESIKTWECEERSKLAEITANYNVIAFFTGHDHRLFNRSVSHDGVIDYTSGHARTDGGGFLVVRLIGNQFHIQVYKNGTWQGGDSWELPMPKFNPSEPIDCQ